MPFDAPEEKYEAEKPRTEKSESERPPESPESELSPEEVQKIEMSATILNTADSPEDIDLFQRYSGVELTEKQREQLLKSDPRSKERTKVGFDILTSMPELDDAERKELERRGVGEKTGRRNKAALQVIDEDSFEVYEVEGGPGRLRLHKNLVRKSQEKKIFLGALRKGFKQGQFGEFSEDEEKTVLAQIDERELFEDWVLGLNGNPEACSEFRNLFRKQEVLGLSSSDMLGELVDIEKRYKLVPPRAYDEERQQAIATEYFPLNESTYGTEQEILTTYDLEGGDVEILGVNASGDVVFLIDNATCAYDPSTSRIDWVKININGTEFLHDPKTLVGQPKSFRREVGLARTKAVLAYHNLPFDGMERDSAIEIMANQTGDVTEFSYDQYSSPLEQKWVSFLTALSPAKGTTGMAFTRLGMMDAGGHLNRDRYTEVIKEWINNRGGRSPAQFLSMLVEKYGGV